MIQESKENPLVSQLIGVLREHKEDSYDTRRKRYYELKGVLDTLHGKFGLQKLKNLSRKHVDRIVSGWKSSSLNPRTVANKLTYLRWLVRKIGKQNLLPRQNKDLGIEPGARHTKAGKIVPEARCAELLAKAEGDPRLRAMLEMGRYFGLRFKEASLLRPLKDWDGNILYIKRGTKGGRPRYVRITNAQQREILERIAGLVTSKDECLIPKDQKYIAWKEQTYDKLRTLGLGRAHEHTFHDLRRSFIHDEMDRLIEKGHSQEEAAKIVAKEVGHNRTEVLRWYGHW